MRLKYSAMLLLLSAAAVFALAACTPALSAAPTETVNPQPIVRSDSGIALAYLDSAGISGEELKADLMSRPELIPFRGVLGGTPAFLPEETVILSESWVFARAEDGHVACSILYRYDIGEEKAVTWSLIGYDLGGEFVTEPER